MFEDLVHRPYALARHRSSPLAEERHRYLVHCAELGMAHNTLHQIAIYLLIITKALRLGDRTGDLISPAEIEAAAIRRVKRRSKPSQSKRKRRRGCSFITCATHWLKFLGRWRQPATAPRPYADRVAAFADYMRCELALAPATVTGRCRVAQEFLDWLHDTQHSLAQLTPLRIDEAVVQKLQKGKLTRVSIQGYASALRSFFRYAELKGWCRGGLADSIRGPRVFSQSTLPSGPSWDDVRRLLATTEGDEPKAIRDRAIVLVLSTYGCRSGEVGHLRLEDLDWQQERISFTRSKSFRTQTYPLCKPVGEAIIRYLKIRPRSAHREVFLRLLAPIAPLCSDSLWNIVGRRLRALGVTLRHYGPHSLRYACATHLLEQGLSLKEIGDHLGHRRAETTRIYTKVDLAGLRQVAEFDLEGLL
jgi:site-specific recombinase XerD